MKTLHLLLLSFLVACGDGSSANTPAEAGAARAATAGASGDVQPIRMDLYVMSRCPYGVQAEQAIIPAAQKFGAALDLHIEYIGKGAAGSLESMHGKPEVDGDLSQVCTRELAPASFLDMISCQNEDMRSIGTNWQGCADRLHLDKAALTACVEGDQGQQLLGASFAKSMAQGATGSPTILLDGKPYQGSRSPMGVLRGLCEHWGDAAPAACADVPAPVAVSAIFLSDARCEECDLHKVEPQLKGTLPGLTVQYLDVGTPEGRAVYDRLKAADPSFKLLPAVLLDPAVEQDEEGYPALQRYLRPLGEYRELRMNGQFDPDAEICDNGIDDDANGQVDCADAGCSSDLLCREEVPKKLDLFVMSHCPYGARALIAANDVKKTFGDDMTVEVHFIGGVTPTGLSSMHGQPEVDDDLRELCAAHVAPAKGLDFAACISRDYKRADWKACAASSGISADAIQGCFDGEGPALLKASFEESGALGIGSSPTYMVNNTRIARAGDAASIQREFCRDNQGLAACGATVEATATEPVPAGACGGQ
ncbi:MAG: hypothetical protein JXX28_18420 [Deltaproteobacteria bacterium]|nr:hypothetical protein [Deltaproteobacteria bacterium]